MVTELYLRDNKIGDDGIKAIAVSLKDSIVTTLDFGNNKIGEKGAQAIAVSLKSSMVTVLRMVVLKERASAIATILATVARVYLYLRGKNICGSLEQDLKNAVMQNRRKLYREHKKYGENLFHLQESGETTEGNMRPGLPHEICSIIGKFVSPVTPGYNLHECMQTGWEAAMLKGHEFVLMSELPENQTPKSNKLYVQLTNSLIEYKVLASDGSVIKGGISDESPDIDYFALPNALDLNDLKFKQKVLNIITKRGHMPFSDKMEQEKLKAVPKAINGFDSAEPTKETSNSVLKSISLNDKNQSTKQFYSCRLM